MSSQQAVLVADDEAVCVAITTKLLEKVGVKVIAAADGVETVHLYQQHWQEIACVLLDVQMPRMNGIEVLKRLKKLNAAVRVIIVSGHVSTANKKQLDLLSPTGYLEKPLTIEALSVFLEPLFQLPGTIKEDC